MGISVERTVDVARVLRPGVSGKGRLILDCLERSVSYRHMQMGSKVFQGGCDMETGKYQPRKQGGCNQGYVNGELNTQLRGLNFIWFAMIE